MKYLNFAKKIVFCMCILSLWACATVFTGTTQKIDVQIVDSANNILSGVNCKIVDGKGVVYPLSSNPGSITVSKGNGALNPMCTKTGYKQSSFGIGQSFNKVSIINILFWPGFIVDAASGAITDYPSHMVVYMEAKH